MFFSGDIKDNKLLLHACCAPCSLGCIAPLLSEGALITLFYYNPCIVDGEFERRLDALETVAKRYGLDLVVPEHDYGGYLSYASPLAEEREGGGRCALCMGDRIKAAAVYAAENGFDAYSTTLSVSPHKSSKLIFSIAEELDGRGVGAPFLARDFKKRDGFKRSVELSKELGIYRQRFCGCEFSLAEAERVSAAEAEREGVV